MKTLLLAGLLASSATPARAFLDTGLDTVWTAQTHLAANPPLPMLRMRPGAWRVTVMPAYITASPGVDEFYVDDYAADGDFSGFGAGASFTYGLGGRHGVYGWFLGSRSSGDATVTPLPGCGGSCSSFQLAGVESSGLLLSAGWAYQLAGGAPGEFSLPVLIGPIVSKTDSSQSVRRSASGFPLLDDFDMRISDTSFGLAVGAQAGIPVGKKFELNPYLLAAMFFTDGCAAYEVTRQGVDNLQSSVKSVECDGARELEAGEDPFGVALGMNVTYLPWNLSLNVTAPFLASWMAREVYGELATVSILSLSWGFGGG